MLIVLSLRNLSLSRIINNGCLYNLLNISLEFIENRQNFTIYVSPDFRAFCLHMNLKIIILSLLIFTRNGKA